MSVQSTRRRGPIDRRGEQRLMRLRLLEILRTTPRYLTIRPTLVASWEACGRPPLLRDASGLAYRQELDNAARRLGLTYKGDPARWALESLHRDVSGRPGHDRPERIAVKAKTVMLEISASALRGEVELLTRDQPPTWWDVRPARDEEHHGRWEDEDRRRPLQFDDWEELRKAAYEAVDEAIQRLRSRHNQNTDPTLKDRNPTYRGSQNRTCKALAYVLGDAAGADLQRNRDKFRHLCEILELDQPTEKRRKNSA